MTDNPIDNNPIVDAIVARIPVLAEADDLTITAQGGGYTNANYRVHAGDKDYVLRIGGPNTALLNIKRRTERNVVLAVAEAGIAPPVAAFLLPEGHMLTELVPGVELTGPTLAEPHNLTRAVELLRRCHALPPVEGAFDPFEDIRVRFRSATELGAPVPDLSACFKRMSELETRARERNEAPVICHGDPFPNNYLGTDERLYLLDWEYGGMGDRYYDLASLVQSIPQLADDLLTAYWGSVNDEQRERLQETRFLVMLWNAGWAWVQAGMQARGGVKEIDRDFLPLARGILAGTEKML